MEFCETFRTFDLEDNFSDIFGQNDLRLELKNEISNLRSKLKSELRLELEEIFKEEIGREITELKEIYKLKRASDYLLNYSESVFKIEKEEKDDDKWLYQEMTGIYNCTLKCKFEKRWKEAERIGWYLKPLMLDRFIVKPPSHFNCEKEEWKGFYYDIPYNGKMVSVPNWFWFNKVLKTGDYLDSKK